MVLDEHGLSTLWERIRRYVSSFMEEWEELSVTNGNEVGLVRPDGTSITVDQDGTIHAVTSIADETDPTVPAWAKQPEKPTYTAEEVGALPDDTVIPTATSQLINNSGFITSESDPTVPAWAKAASKPTYTAAEVGALPSSTQIPTKVSQLTNDSGFITSVPVATSNSVGTVKPDGSTITVDPDGTIHGSAQVDVATTQAVGVVKPDGTSVTIESDGTIHAAASEFAGPHWEVRTIDGAQRLVIVIPEGE